MDKKNLIYWFLGISIILIILDSIRLLAVIKDPLDKFIIPIKKSIYLTGISVSNLSKELSAYTNFKKILEEHEKIAKINEELTIKVNLLSQENEALKKQLNISIPKAPQLIEARVIGVSRFMEIEGGVKDGIAEGNIVVDGSVLIGRIVTVEKFRSKIMLPTDSEIVIPAKTSRGTMGTVSGQSGTSVILDKVLQKDPLFLEDQVVTSGMGEYPPNLLIGQIAHISSDDVSVYKQAKVVPLVDYKNEKIVFVIPQL